MKSVVFKWSVVVSVFFMLWTSCSFAQTTQWRWTTNVIPNTVFESRDAAETAIRNLGGKYALADRVEQEIVTDTKATYVYGANPRDPDIGPWHGFCIAWATHCPHSTEADAVQDVIDSWDPGSTCPGGRRMVPLYDWTMWDHWYDQTTSIRDEKKWTFFYLSSNPPCDEHQAVLQGWRLRDVSCPNPLYLYWSTTEGKCILHDIARIYGAPLVFTCHVGDPCDVGTGDNFQTEADISLPWITFRRFYHSQARFPGEALGIGWTHSLNERLLMSGAVPAARITGNGHQAPLRNMDSSNSTFEESTGSNIRVLKSGAEWKAILPGGIRNVFDSSGRLVRIEQPDGQSIVLTYTTYGALDSATNSSGRSLQFRYGGDPVHLVGIDSAGSELLDYSYDNDRLQSVQFANGTSRVYWYEDPTFPNHLTGISDEKGTRFATFSYDTQGRAESASHAGGVELTTLQYNADGSTTVMTPLQHTKIYSFTGTADPYYRMLTGLQDQGLPQVWQRAPYATDFRRRVISATDARGVETTFAYSDLGTLRTEHRVEAVGTSEQRTIDVDRDLVLNRVIAERRLNSERRMSFNARGQMVARCEIDPNDSAAMSYACSATTAPPVGAKVRRTVNTYCDSIGAGCPLVGLLRTSNGARLTSDPGMNGLDDVVTYDYRESDDPTCATNGACTYRKGDLWKVTNALGQVTETVKYDKAGRPLLIKDANGTLTDFTYHPRGWLVDRIVRSSSFGFPNANDAVTHIDYDPVGNVTKVTQPDGAFLAYTYDAAHRLIKISDNLDNAIDYCPGGVGSAECLDAAGNRRVEKTKDGAQNIKRTLRRTYNTLSQLTSVRNANNDPTLSYPASVGDPQIDGYDANGNATNSTDGLNVKTHQDYDPLNRLKTTIQDYLGTDPDTANTTTGYVYDARDNLRTVTDPEGYPTNYDYDGLNNLTGLHSPDTGDTAYTYDLDGNRISQTDNRGVTSTYTYDALNRLTGIAYPTSTLNVSFAYDQSNATTGCTVSYPQGRLTQMTDESGQTTYCYDRRGNVTLKTQQDFGQRVVAYSYTLADRLASMTYPSGAIVTYGRDSVGRINSVKRRPDANSADVTIVSNASYYPFGPLNVLTYGNGRILTKDYDDNYAINSIASSDPSGLILDFTTDVMGNIVDASDSINATVKTRKYVYDHLYRLSGVTDNGNNPLEGYAYNQTGDRTHKQLGAQAPQVYSYLANTHRLDSVDGAPRAYDDNGNTLQRGDGVSFSYNDRNRLSIVSPPAFGSGPKAFGPPKSNQTYYSYNGRGERVSISHSLQLTTTSYAYDEQGHHLGSYFGYSNSGDEVIYLDDMPVAITDGGVLSYLETDHLGTPRIAANVTTNAQQWKWDFFGDAFGGNEPVIAAKGGIDVRLRYPGQYADGFGVNYNYFRDYEAGTGRYLESDPIGLEGGISSYAYVSGNSFGRIDPSGLEGIGPWTFPPGPERDAYNRDHKPCTDRPWQPSDPDKVRCLICKYKGNTSGLSSARATGSLQNSLSARDAEHYLVACDLTMDGGRGRSIVLTLLWEALKVVRRGPLCHQWPTSPLGGFGYGWSGTKCESVGCSGCCSQ
jgi:RHS repeat-associated protein